MQRRASWPLLPACLAVLAASSAWAAGAPAAAEAVPPVPAPAAPGDPEDEARIDIYVDEDEDAERLLRQAARLSNDGQWRLCLERFQECLRLHGGRVTRSAGDPELYLSVADVVRREMAAVPPAGQAFWRTLRLADFETRLRAARARGCAPTELAELARNFVGLDFSAPVLLDLGEALHARGDVAGAVRAWRELLRLSPRGDYPRQALIARAGLAAAAAGLVTDAEWLLALLQREAGLLNISVAGKEISAAEAIATRLQEAGAGALAAATTDEWGATGGDFSRAMPAPPPAAITAMRWQRELPVPEHWTGGTAAMQAAMMMGMGIQPALKTDSWPYPAFHAAATGELVVLAGDMGVMALRAHDGAAAWQAPEGVRGVARSSTFCGPVLSDGLLMARQGRSVTAPPGQYRQLPATVSELLLLNARTGGAAVNTGSIPAPPEADRLRPVEPAGAGNDKGDAGEEPGADENSSAAAGASTVFVGSPVSDAGLVVGAVVRSGSMPEMELAGFSRADGSLRWRRFICSGRALRASTPHWSGGGLPLTEEALPLAADGASVFTVTNLGAIAAADKGTGDLRWLRTYPRATPEAAAAQANNMFNPAFSHAGRKPFDPAGGEIWEACAPLLAGGLLLATPQDCDYLLAIDPANGGLAWRAPRCGLRRLLGAAGGRVILSGADEIVARDLRTGRALWRTRLKARVIGHGTVGQDYVAVSTEKALEIIDLAGRPLRSFAWKNPKAEAGNVLVHGENIYTVSATHVNAYCNMEEVASRLARAAGEPGHALPRFLSGTMELAAGRREQAVQLLEEALKLAAPGETWAGQNLAEATRTELWKCSIESAVERSAGGDAAGALAALDTALKHSPGGERLARTLQQRALLQEKAARPAEAVATYRRLLTECPNVPCLRADGVRLRGSMLATAEIARLAAAADPGLLAAQEAQAAELLAEARRDSSSETAIRVAQQYPSSRSAAEALALAAELARRDGRTDLELRTLRQRLLLDGRSRQEMADSCARLALAYARQRYGEAAAALTRRLEALGETVMDAGREMTPEQFVAAHPELRPRGLPSSTPPLRERWRAGLSGARLLTGCAGDSSLVLSAGSRVLQLDAARGTELWSHETAPGQNMPGNAAARWMTMAIPAVVSGDSVMLLTGGNMVALGRLDGRVRWKRPTAQQQGRAGAFGALQYAAGSNPEASWAGTDGLILLWDTASRLDQLGQGTIERVLRAISIDDGGELWSMSAASFEQGSAQAQQFRYGYGSGGATEGIMRTGDGRVLAWLAVPAPPGAAPKPAGARAGYYGGGAAHHTRFILAEPPSGRVLARFDTDGATVLGLSGNLVVCLRTSDRKILALSLDGNKVWESAGAWNQAALSPGGDRLVGTMNNTVGNTRSQVLAMLDAASGRIVWRETPSPAQTPSTVNYNAFPGYGQNTAHLDMDGDMLLTMKSVYNPAGIPGTAMQRENTLWALDARSGRELWKTPFVGQAQTVCALGRDHVATAFGETRLLDAEGLQIDARKAQMQMQMAVVAAAGNKHQPATVENRSILRLFDRVTGKAVWEEISVEKTPIDGQQPFWVWQQRTSRGLPFWQIPGGFLVSWGENLILLSSEKK